MQAITLGNPNLFVKGMVEVVVTDPTTGNIIGYDNVSTESAVTTSVNMGEITGGFGNPLLMNIPDTTRISGTLTSQAFSLQQRALTTGGKLSYNAVTPFCETVNINDEQGTYVAAITRTPVKAYGQPASDTNCWCYIRPHGMATQSGVNVAINPATNGIVNFPAEYVTAGYTSFDVFYFVNNASSQALALPSSFNPSVATIRLKYGVYAKQNNTVSHGTLQGYLYFIVPRAQFTGDAGVGANQTTNSTTAYDWTALMPDNGGMMDCVACGGDSADYAYYVYAPCGDVAVSAKNVVIIGGNITATAGTAVSVPVVLIMNDNTVVTPDYTQITITTDPSATVSGNKITFAGPGDYTVTATAGDLSTTVSATVSEAS